REQLEEHVREAEERAGGKALARGQLLGEREVGAVGEVVAVDEEELGVAGRCVVELQLLPCQRLRHLLRVYGPWTSSPSRTSTWTAPRPSSPSGTPRTWPSSRCFPPRTSRRRSRRSGRTRPAP